MFPSITPTFRTQERTGSISSKLCAFDPMTLLSEWSWLPNIYNKTQGPVNLLCKTLEGLQQTVKFLMSTRYLYGFLKVLQNRRVMSSALLFISCLKTCDVSCLQNQASLYPYAHLFKSNIKFPKIVFLCRCTSFYKFTLSEEKINSVYIHKRLATARCADGKWWGCGWGDL